MVVLCEQLISPGLMSSGCACVGACGRISQPSAAQLSVPLVLPVLMDSCGQSPVNAHVRFCRTPEFSGNPPPTPPGAQRRRPRPARGGGFYAQSAEKLLALCNSTLRSMSLSGESKWQLAVNQGLRRVARVGGTN